MSKFYSKLISDSFYKKINELKIRKGFIDIKYYRKILDFTFIFIDVKNCNSVIVEENELKTKEIEINEISNILVLLNTETKCYTYWNQNYEFIGIFDKYGKDFNIYFSSIAISSISFTSDFARHYYHSKIINSFDIIFIRNPFVNYMEEMIKPIREMINDIIPEEMKDCTSFKINGKNILNTFNFTRNRRCEYRIFQFNDLLKDVKILDESIRNNLLKNNRISNLNPVVRQ
jgi:hypothetical protein